MDPGLLMTVAFGVVIATIVVVVSRAARSGTPPPQLEPAAREWTEADGLALHPVVRALGLSAAGKVASGTVDGALVRVSFLSPVELDVSILGLPSGLSLREESLNPFFRLVHADDVRVGDAAFDEAIRVRGDEALVLALLDAPARAAIREELVRHSFRIAGGSVQWTAQVFTSADELAAIARSAIALARRLSLDEARVAERLAANLEKEPDGDVRVRILEVIAARFPHHPARNRALDLASKDRSLAVRLLAANLAKGPGAANSLRSFVEDPAAPDAERATALKSLSRLLPPDEAREIAGRLFEASAPLARAALELAASIGWRPPADMLLPALSAAHPDVRAAAAAIADAADPRVEAALLALLENNESRVTLSAIRTLGRSGGRAAVEKIHPFTRSVLGGDLKRAALEAIDAIQERHPGIAGQLTLSDEGAAGRLSDAAQPGAVTLARKNDKQST